MRKKNLKIKREKLQNWKASDGDEGKEEYRSKHECKVGTEKGKMAVYDKLYEELETREGEKKKSYSKYQHKGVKA